MIRLFLFIGLIVLCYFNWHRIVKGVTKLRMEYRHSLTRAKIERIKFFAWIGLR